MSSDKLRPMQFSGALGRMVVVDEEKVPIFNMEAGQKPADIVEVVMPPPSQKQKTTVVRTIQASPKDVVALAKARLKEVKAELKNKAALEKEKAQLERLIAAAEDKKPRAAVVREIKRNAG
jgi:hypothetical protein